jgi:hypothetical protein
MYIWVFLDANINTTNNCKKSIIRSKIKLSKMYVQSNHVNPALLLTVNLLFGQNFLTPELFIIPTHVSVISSIVF